MVFAATLGFLALIPLSVIWRGYALTVLWAWFVAPTFGLPELAIAPAIGLSLVVRYLTHQSDAVKTPEGDFGERMAKACAYALLLPLLVLGIGWVVHQFM
jgi:hypothetical protein